MNIARKLAAAHPIVDPRAPIWRIIDRPVGERGHILETTISQYPPVDASVTREVVRVTIEISPARVARCCLIEIRQRVVVASLADHLRGILLYMGLARYHKPHA